MYKNPKYCPQLGTQVSVLGWVKVGEAELNILPLGKVNAVLGRVLSKNVNLSAQDK